MVKADEPLLNVGPGAHSRSGADKHPHRAAVHFLEEEFLLLVGVGFLDKPDLVCGNTALDKIILDLLVSVPATGLGNPQFLDLYRVEPLQAITDAPDSRFISGALGRLQFGHELVVGLDDLVIAFRLGDAPVQEDKLGALFGRPFAMEPHNFIGYPGEFSAFLVAVDTWPSRPGIE